MVNFYEVASILETGSANGSCQALARGTKKLQIVAQGFHLALLTQKKELNK